MRIRYFALFVSAIALALAGCANPIGSDGFADDAATRALVGPSPTTYYVANNGNNNNTGTSKDSPLKTITWALEKAAAKNPTVSKQVFVHAAPGTYNQMSGEIFPLVVPANVNLIGDIANKGNGAVPTQINGRGLLDQADNSTYASIQLLTNASVAGFIIRTNTADDSARTFGVAIGNVEDASVSQCAIIYNETGVYIWGNAQATLHDNIIEKNETGVHILTLTPASGTITELYRNSIRYNTARGVNLSLDNGSIPPDLGGQLIGYTNNQILGPIPIYGKGQNVLAWNTYQDVYINTYGWTNDTFTLWARNNSWSKIYNGGNSGGVIFSAYNKLSIDSGNATLAPNTPALY